MTRAHDVQYVAIVERVEHNFAGYIPDLPGVASTGNSAVDVLRSLEEGARIYIETLREEGLPVPEPSSTTEAVSVRVA